MISIRIKTDENGYTGFEARGHAEYAEAPNDIICAACSVLMINTVNSLEMITKDRVISEDEEGVLICTFPEGLSEKGKVLMDSMVAGLEDIEEEYGSRYIHIEKSVLH